MTARNEAGQLTVEKGTMSLINAVLAMIFLISTTWLISGMYGSIVAKQDQTIALLQNHGTDIQQIKLDLASMHAHSVAVYPTRIDLNEFSIFADDLQADNPQLKVPSIWRIHQEHPPMPLPQ